MFHVAWIINAEKKFTGELCTPRNATKRQHLATDYSLCSLHSLYENLTGRFWTEAIRDKNSEPGCGSFSVALCHLTIVQNLPALFNFFSCCFLSHLRAQEARRFYCKAAKIYRYIHTICKCVFYFKQQAYIIADIRASFHKKVQRGSWRVKIIIYGILTNIDTLIS